MNKWLVSFAVLSLLAVPNMVFGQTAPGGDDEFGNGGGSGTGQGNGTIAPRVLNDRGCLDITKDKVPDSCPDSQSSSCPTWQCYRTRYYCVQITVPPHPQGDGGPQVTEEITKINTTASFDNYPEVGPNIEGNFAINGASVVCYKRRECLCTGQGVDASCGPADQWQEVIIRQYTPKLEGPKCTKASPRPRPE
jgi:hypothetical protein